ncbi:heterokaryon incompatibility protein-domain-containing protein [Cercophora newfieldiana]|uniref:Heterokaryon incompatibility protein-domain-containing protein n=1 Tax=Cercophora newfieldiana TaxID=92897 RepID=A0AA39Y1E9_9PEZI|nr:heterokaryon incompatibility protein-domain-containing protein [Cercophora newfieldiana]
MLHLLYVLEEIRRSAGAVQLPPGSPTEVPPWAMPDAAKEPRKPRLFRLTLNPHEPQEPETGSSSPPTDDEERAEVKYTPLGDADIRLLHLLPGRDTEPLRCELIQAPLASTEGKYDALSYCWGSLTAAATLYCNGALVSITTNLAEALRAFRLPEEPRTLWVDALCINQKDSREKSHQIPLMNRIYRGASSVQIWLGNDTPSQPLTQALNILRNVHRLCARWGWDLNFAYIMLQRELWKESGLPDIADDAWRSIKYLVEMPWFSRTWVIQEVILSRDAYLHSNNTSLRWLEFCTAYLSLSPEFVVMRPDMLPTLPAYARVMELMLSYHKAGAASTDLNLLAFFENHRLAQATDPRDKIYGFLGIHEELAGALPQGIIPDYESSIQEVYAATATRIIQRTNSLEVLGSAGLRKPGEGVADLPSWVPDWSISDIASTLNYKTVDGTYLYNFNATGTTSLHSCPAVFEGDQLHLSGFCFDKVIEVGDANDLPLRKGTATVSILQVVPQTAALFLSWFRASGCLQRDKKYPGGRDMVGAFVQTIFLGHVPPVLWTEETATNMSSLLFSLSYNLKQRRSKDSSQPTSARIVNLLLGVLLRHVRPGAFSLLARALKRLEDRRPVSPIMRAEYADMSNRQQEREVGAYHALYVRLRSLSRRLFVTKGGYMGLGPREMQPGDEVFLVRGSRTPLVFRAKPGSVQRELVGDCYVCGIMQGEAFDDEKCAMFEVI